MFKLLIYTEYLDLQRSLTNSLINPKHADLHQYYSMQAHKDNHVPNTFVKLHANDKGGSNYNSLPHFRYMTNIWLCKYK